MVTRKSVLIEVADEAAGVLVEGTRGYKFHAVHPRLQHLHGVQYNTVQAAESAAREGLRQLAKAS